MKTSITAIIFMTLLFVFQSHAQHGEHEHNHEGEVVETPTTSNNMENAACEDTINIKVSGLVCDFCARSLEKVFLKRGDIAGINVDLGKSSIMVAMKPGLTVDDATLAKLITDSGYNVSAIKRGCEHG
ncbi:MAG: heavy metal-associated domain-containing protein [Candidatus Dadabacteria bacterium]|nr:heavy metal-associated domain-containing protein [Candidatus Dadabacteria bacterium]MDE0519127.1 heavy metal-associated domain-containing protein [Candidatus Dadabacteria bacterium]MDE0662317.1 heavy metal-associated domain-containing protein [Candidatus Dadabacteria bacterium]